MCGLPSHSAPRPRRLPCWRDTHALEANAPKCPAQEWRPARCSAATAERHAGTSRRYRTKAAKAEEAAWTCHLRPDLFVGWKDGTMILVDTTHRTLRESAASDPALFVQAARLVPQLAARALAPDAPPPMAPLDPEDALTRYWEERGLVPPRAGELIERVRAAGS